MDNVTLGKNLIMKPGTSVASGTVSFATGATAAATVSADIAIPVYPVSLYMISIYNCATQTTIECQINNVRSIYGTSRAFESTSVAYTTGQCKDSLMEGLFAGNATGIRLVFSLGTAATAAEIISAEYMVYPVR